LNRRIINFYLEGKNVLGLDTGLNAQAFAQAKMAQFITCPGFIVRPDGSVEPWLPGGVSEQEGSMVIWGPFFPGTELLELISDSGRREEALNAVRFWLRARVIMEDRDNADEAPYPGPAGAFIVTERDSPYPAGTVFFPPFRLLKRTLDAEKAEHAERWAHPDLKGSEGISFCAGAMLYRVFCGEPPFPREDGGNSGSPQDELRQDIREGVFMPPGLASPGLDPEMAALISAAMSRIPKNKEEKIRPAAGLINDFIGAPFSRPASSWVKTPDREELAKIRAEYEQYGRKKALQVKTRRFVIRNTAVIAVVAAALIALMLGIRGHIRHQAELPSTRGMTPVEVVETFYGAYGELDHTLMEACVINKAGKGDIDMVVNLFVMSRVRQAYETTVVDPYMSAMKWIEAGRPDAVSNVFGVTDLNVRVLSESGESLIAEAGYILWMPGSYFRDEEEGLEEPERVVIPPPGGQIIGDRLELTFRKDAWRISNIERVSSRRLDF
jgi:hypothetical protein